MESTDITEIAQSIRIGKIPRIATDESIRFLGVFAGISYYTDFPLLLIRVYVILGIALLLSLAYLAGGGTQVVATFGVMLLCYVFTARHMPKMQELPVDYDDRVGVFPVDED